METEIYKNHIELLGLKAIDKITEFSGIIESVSFDLYGCIQACVKPPVNNDGTVPNGYWFDVSRLEIDRNVRKMELPNFSNGYVADGKKGPANKPSKNQQNLKA